MLYLARKLCDDDDDEDEGETVFFLLSLFGQSEIIKMRKLDLQMWKHGECI
jgi:hypothetical protein